ncbi:YafY family protein [soil metagenome]
MRRIERLINLIAALLDARGPLTADDIKETIAGYDQPNHEAFRRAFERDKEALRAMGVPLEVVPTDPFSDHADGYVISPARYYLPELDLEPDELAALRMASEAVLGGKEEAAAGLLKLTMSEGVTPWDGPRVVWGADLAAEQPLLAPLYASVLARRPVAFGYRRAGEDDAERRTVEPYAVVHQRGNWYLVGRDTARDGLRSFRVSRIVGRLEELDGSYAIPEGFDPLAQASGEAWEIGPGAPGAATVRFDADLAWWPEQNMPNAIRRPGPGGAVDVEVPVSNLDALVSWVIGFAGGAEVTAPQEARIRMRDHLATWSEGDAP